MYTENSGGRRRIWRLMPAMLPALLIAAIMLLAACAPAVGQRSAPLATASKTGAAANAANACLATSSSARLEPTDTARTLPVSLVLRSHSAGADAAIAALNDPKSPDYHHFLSPGEYARRFGVDSATVASITAALQAAGLRVATSTGDRWPAQRAGNRRRSQCALWRTAWRLL